MEARLAALEAGGGIDPRTGLFSTYREQSLSAPANVWTPIPMDTEKYDFSNWFDLADGKYKPQLKGWYRLDAYVLITTEMAVGSYAVLTIGSKWGLAGGSQAKPLDLIHYRPGVNTFLKGTAMVQVTEDQAASFPDVWYPTIAHTHTGPVNISVGTAPTYPFTYFQGHLIAPGL
jgi:hypothetical protein